MKRRLLRLAFVGCLVLLAFHGVSRSISGEKKSHRHRLILHLQKPENVTPTPAAAGGSTVRRRSCEFKRINLCGYFARAEKNESLIADDKRLVPTGPNPLHN